MDYTNAECSINVPGLWHNGDCSLLCRPTKWYDIFIFFVGNYLAHVATVVSPPGVNSISRTLNLLGALLLPSSGLGLGIEAILSWAIFAPTPLETAARSGALLMVVRKNTADEDAQESLRTPPTNSAVAQNEGPERCADLGQNTISTPEEHSYSYRPWMTARVHGYFWLPENFGLECVPYDAKFENDKEEILPKHKANKETSKWYDFLFGFSKRDRTANDVAYSYSWAKAIVAIVQIIFGVYTMYRTRGNQIERFGYAAYGFTVTQYALMSIVNLAGNLIRPDYTFLYIVGSSVSDELQKTYPCTIDTIGRLRETSNEVATSEGRRRVLERPRGLYVLELGVLYLGVGIHILIIGLMTKFNKGQSTLAQRAWTMAWLSVGAGYGFTTNLMRKTDFDATRDVPGPTSKGSRLFYGVHALAILMLGTPTIGGFVVVAQMISQYGVCSKILDADV